MPQELDLLIIGAGPAGLSAAYAAAQQGLDYLVLEKGTIANTIRRYPVGRSLFSTPNELEMIEGTLKPVREKPTREELLTHYIQFVLANDLKINTPEEINFLTVTFVIDLRVSTLFHKTAIIRSPDDISKTNGSI